MTSFVNRATPRQNKVMRIIKGAVLNAFHAHPRWTLDHPRLAGSIAKRAAGTITAAWPGLLAVPPVATSETADGQRVRPQPSPQSGGYVNRAGRAASHESRRRAPLRKVHSAISRLVGPAKRAGNAERAEALVEVLRIVGNEIRRQEQKMRR